jgi:hypothetical protein
MQKNKLYCLLIIFYSLSTTPPLEAKQCGSTAMGSMNLEATGVLRGVMPRPLAAGIADARLPIY